LTRIFPSSIVSVGFSHWTSLPPWIAMTLISVCQWSGVEIMTASMSWRASTSRKSLVAAQSLLPYFWLTLRLGLGQWLLSTSQTARTRASG
jgi:hypothetical protein